MRKGLLIVSLLLIMAGTSGCSTVNGFFLGGAGGHGVSPYRSEVVFGARGDADLKYELIGEGNGTSCGWIALFGLLGTGANVHDAMQQAVEAKGGDILIDVRTGNTIKSYFGPLIYAEGCITARGLVAKIKQTTPLPNTQDTNKNLQEREWPNP